MSNTLAIIAGSGRFPFHVAAEAARRGRRVVAIGLTGWVDGSLANSVAAYDEVSVGQLGELVRRLQAHGATEAVMAGKVTKEVLLDPRVQFDAEALVVLSQAGDASVSGVLGGIGRLLATRGIRLLDSSTFLTQDLCPVGAVTARAPSEEEWADIRVGAAIARELARLDVGQTIVVRRRVVVAVEALEGTDAAIRRAGQVGGPGGVVVKMASPTQDMRFDIPVLGPQTIAAAAEAGARCIAVEAGKTLLLDRPALIAAADAAGVAIVGVDAATV